MATERQYDFYKLLYDEENARSEQLPSQAKHYLSLATLYSAFVIFFVEKVLPAIETEHKQPSSILAMKIVFIATICAMAASFLFSLLVVQVSDFEALTTPKDIIVELKDKEVTDKEFFKDRIADITVAFSRNSDVNDGKAIYLQCAGLRVIGRHYASRDILHHQAFLRGDPMAKKAKRKKSKTSSGKPLSARVAKREMVKKRKK